MAKVKKYTIVQVLVMWAWGNHAKFTPIVYHRKLHRMAKQLMKEAYEMGRRHGAVDSYYLTKEVRGGINRELKEMGLKP